MSKSLTREEALSRAEDFDQLADNEDNEAAYYRLRSKAATWRERATHLRSAPIPPESRETAGNESSEREDKRP